MATIILAAFAGLCLLALFGARSPELASAAMICTAIFICGAVVCASIDRARRALGGSSSAERRSDQARRELAD